MTLNDIDSFLVLCRTHIVGSKSNDSQIPTFLTSFLLIQISAEYDKEIKRSLSKRVSQSGDSELTSFIDGTVNRKRNWKIDDIKNVLNRLDSRRGDLFDSWTKDTENAAMYSNIITNRNSAAHGTITQMTLDELDMTHTKAKNIIKFFQDALYHNFS